VAVASEQNRTAAAQARALEVDILLSPSDVLPESHESKACAGRSAVR
jgi:hypothetical protein